MSKSLINPFELLGITEKSSIREARKSYYKLALICHPDCGGHEESMKVLVNAYTFVEEQLKNKNDISEDIGEKLEKDFEEFCKNQKEGERLPRMTELYDLADMQEKIEDMDERDFSSYNRQFNIEFEEEQKYNFEELATNNPFSQGYGNLMDDDHDYDTDEEFVMPTKNVFKGEIQIYKEPHILPDTYGNEFRYDITSVDDFSNYENNEYDYKRAHSELENPPKEIQSNMDKPINNLESDVERLRMERENLVKNMSYSQIDIRK